MNRATSMQGAGKAIAVAALAATAVATTRADEQTEVQKKTAELTQQTELLKAEVALLQAKWPQFAGGKEGKLGKGTGGVYALGAWDQVYERLGDAVDEICAALMSAKTNTPPVLLSAADLDAGLRYRIAAREQQAILAAIAQLTAPVAAADPAKGGVGAMATPLATVAAVLPSLMSLTKLFRTDVALHDETVAIAERTLTDLVHRRARDAHALSLGYPAVAGLYALSGAQTTAFGQGVEDIINQRSAVQGVIDDKSNATKGAQATALLARMDKFVAELYTVPATAGARAPIAEVLLGEAVGAAVKGSGAMLLVAIVQQGGNSMITSNAWREDRLYVGGGVVVDYKLIDQGQLLASGTIRKVDPQFRRVMLEQR